MQEDISQKSRACGPSKRLRITARQHLSVSAENPPRWVTSVQIAKLVDQNRRGVTKRGCSSILAGMDVKVQRLMRCCVQFKKPAWPWITDLFAYRIDLCASGLNETKENNYKNLLKFWCESSTEFYKSFVSCHGCWAWESFPKRTGEKKNSKSKRKLVSQKKKKCPALQLLRRLSPKAARPMSWAT